MKTYNTYQEAKIANPDQEIKTDNLGNFFVSVGHTTCNPAGYCVTVEQFLKDGHKFEVGDLYITLGGRVEDVHNLNFAKTMNESDDGFDYKRYILQAKALEEPKQVEWLGLQVEIKWEVLHGEQWIPCIRLGKDIYGHHAYQLSDGEFMGEFNGTPNLSDFRKPETPEQKAERERLEAAYDLYIEFNSSCGYKAQMGYEGFIDSDLSNNWLAIVEKTNYRKQ